MDLFNRLVVASLPAVPLPVVRRLAARYIAGETLEDAIRTVRKLQEEGACATLDVLGEDVTSSEQAVASRQESVRTLQAIARERVDSNLSIKLTSLGLKVDLGFCEENLRELLKVAAELGIFVRFDMEDSTSTTDTLRLFRTLHQDFPLTGIVVQACLRRTEADVRELLPLGVRFRVVKGIYREPAIIAFQDPQEIQKSFLSLVGLMLRSGRQVGIATHDEVLVDGAEQLIRELGLTREQYEFQMLLGVLPELRQRLIAKGHRLRVYAPFGSNWYGYSTRRFKENPAVAGYVFRALFRKG
jgi:proline dehydrogenase